MKKQCTIDAIMQFCAMEMWRTAAPPMESRHSRPDGKAAGIPTARKHRFPQLRKHDRLPHIPTAPTTANIFPMPQNHLPHNHGQSIEQELEHMPSVENFQTVADIFKQLGDRRVG